jgi:transposase
LKTERRPPKSATIGLPTVAPKKEDAMDRYIGLDVHATTTTMAIVGPSGKRIRSVVLETNAKVIVEALRAIPGRRHVCLEEGAQAEWLWQVLKPHSDELVVTMAPESRGQKSDARDAFALADRLRTSDLHTTVFKDVGAFATLREINRLYTRIVGDVVRVKNRLKSLFLSRGIQTADGNVYAAKNRQAWLRKLPTGKRWAAETYYAELDRLSELRDQVEAELVRETHKHPTAKNLQTCPGIGPIRAAQLMAVVVTPHRFRTRRQFWAYCGLGIVMRSSSDYVRDSRGRWVHANIQTTRGLNLNRNALLKHVFKGAATTVIGQRTNELSQQYARLLANGVKPNLAKLTVARRIAATVLALWKTNQEYDPTKHRKQAA